MHNLENLKVWKKAMHLVEKIYEISSDFPKEEKYGLTSQIRRSAISIPSNIAEGAGRNTKGEFKNFLGIASGSTYELTTQLLIAKRLGFVEKCNVNPILHELNEIQKMTYSLMKSF